MSEKEIRAKLKALKDKQAAALKAVEEAQRAMEQKQAEQARAEADMKEASAQRERAAGEIETAAKMLSGEDGTVAKLVEGLEKDGYAYVDSFLGEPLATYIRQEMQIMHATGRLKESELAGGKTGGNVKYSMSSVRGDVVAFVDGDEEGCHNIGLLRQFVDQTVLKVQDRVDELKGTTIQRGRLMCTCYPGGDKEGEECGKGGPCRYVRHCDNPDSNGRILTTLYYLNPEWVVGHGGELRIYPQAADGSRQAPVHDIEPLHDRFVIFWSDRRNPHEVLFSKRPRYAVTTWYYSEAERREAVEGGGGAEEEMEARRIMGEIDKFRNQTGSAPSRIEGVDAVEMVKDTHIRGVVDFDKPQNNYVGGGGGGGVVVDFDLEELD